jgi:hypothetical protein
VNGRNYTSTGTYYDTLSTAFGCDSILTLRLTVNPIAHDSIYRLACPGEFVVFGGISRSVDGTYWDTATTRAGCDSIIQLVLHFGNIPTIPVITAGDTLTCGTETLDSFRATSTDATSFIWGITPSGAGSFDANGNLTWNFAYYGDAVVTVTAVNRCGTSPARTFAVHRMRNPYPVFGYVLTGRTANFTNISFFATSYMWYFGDGNTSTDSVPSYTYSTYGTYTVTLVATNACGSDSMQNVINVRQNAIADLLNGNESLSIYPNPFSEMIHLDFEADKSKELHLEMIDLQGRVVWEGNHHYTNSPHLDGWDIQEGLDRLAPGTYIMHLRSTDGVHSFRLTKYEN